jgi:hypothetical protein
MKNPCEHRRKYNGKWMACEFHNDLHSKMWEPCISCKKRIYHDLLQFDPYVRTREDFNGIYTAGSMSVGVKVSVAEVE